MKPFLFRVYPLLCLAVFAMAGMSLARTPAGPPDFGSDVAWQDRDVALVRVVSVTQGVVVLRTERSYTGQHDPADTTVPLSAFWFGTYCPAGSPVPVDKPVSVSEGDEILVWPSRSQPREHPSVPGTKIASPAAESGLIKSVEQISKLRAAGGQGPGHGSRDEIQRLAKLRDAGGEAALRGGMSSKDPTVVRFCLSTLDTFQPIKPDEQFADRLRSLRSDVSLPISERFSANRLYPRYTAAPEQAAAEAAQWPRSLFAAGKAESEGDMRLLVTEIIDSISKRDDRVAYFLPLVGDETKPRPTRIVSAWALGHPDCFDYEHPDTQAASDIFAALLALLKSKDPELRMAGSRSPDSVCDRIKSKKERDARAQEVLLSLRAAIQGERDERVRECMEACELGLGRVLKRK
jgi:hypothetical protein